MTTHTFIHEGKKRSLFTRQEGGPFYFKIKRNGKQIWINLETPNKKTAEALARNHLRNLKTGRFDEVRNSLRQRAPAGAAAGPTIGQVVEAFKNAPGEANGQTKNDYLWALRTLVERVKGVDTPWLDHPASILDKALVHQFRSQITAQVQKDGGTDADMSRAWRTGNSILRQARAVFAPDMLEHYALSARLGMPDMQSFRSAPAFKGAKKTEYQIPDDDLLAHTFEELEATREAHPDRYLICWLVLGFGLRKSEIANLTPESFKIVDGRIHVELSSVIVKGIESNITKNGQECPRIPVSNGAWEKLAPIINAAPRGAFLLQGSKDYRWDESFRQVNAWLGKLGWKTEKKIHELRAFAGCRVIMRNGLHAGSMWLRHGSVATTQQYYGRYVKNVISDEPITLGRTDTGRQLKVI